MFGGESTGGGGGVVTLLTGKGSSSAGSVSGNVCMSTPDAGPDGVSGHVQIFTGDGHGGSAGDVAFEGGNAMCGSGAVNKSNC